MKKYWAFSAGGGFIIGLFVLFVAHAGEPVSGPELKEPQPAVIEVEFTKIPIVVMPKGETCEKE
jgi:hypothetical protein